MKTIHCDIHNNDINIILPDESCLFCENGTDTVVMFDSDNKLYAKRYRMGQCDLMCKTMLQILEGQNK